MGGFLLLLWPPSLVSNPESRVTFAMGPFILIRREIFDKVGGYNKIKDKITDDVCLAKLVKQAGFNIALINGQEMLHIRMYENIKEIWTGWSKNMFLGFTYLYNLKSIFLRILTAIGGFIGILLIFVIPFIIMVLSGMLALITGMPSWNYVFLFSLLSWFCVIGIQAYIQIIYKGYPIYSTLSFLGGIVTSGMFLNSAIKILSKKGIVWKDRVYFGKN